MNINKKEVLKIEQEEIKHLKNKYKNLINAKNIIDEVNQRSQKINLIIDTTDYAQNIEEKNVKLLNKGEENIKDIKNDLGTLFMKEICKYIDRRKQISQNYVDFYQLFNQNKERK